MVQTVATPALVLNCGWDGRPRVPRERRFAHFDAVFAALAQGAVVSVRASGRVESDQASGSSWRARPQRRLALRAAWARVPAPRHATSPAFTCGAAARSPVPGPPGHRSLVAHVGTACRRVLDARLRHAPGSGAPRARLQLSAQWLGSRNRRSAGTRPTAQTRTAAAPCAAEPGSNRTAN